jgi:hypothetical protein
MKSLELHPPPENGIHSWVYGRATWLYRQKVSRTVATQLIEETALRHGTRRPLAPREVSDAVDTAYGGTTAPSVGGRVRRLRHTPSRKGEGWDAEITTPSASCDPAVIEKALAAVNPWPLEDVWEDSPLRVDDLNPAQVLSLLFAPDDLLCTGTVHNFEVSPMSELLNRGEVGPQVVPSPNRKLKGRAKKGHLSGHCRDAVGPRRYLICEFDDPELDADKQATLLRFLRDVAGGELRMIIHSGGKSLHGWFTAQEDEASALRFFKVACRLGADPRMWLPEQMGRTPNGVRDNGKPQKCFYLKGES